MRETQPGPGQEWWVWGQGHRAADREVSPGEGTAPGTVSECLAWPW